MIVLRLRRLFLFTLTLILAASVFPGAAQGEGSVDMVSVSQNGGEVSYPQLRGFANTFVQDTVNQAILTEGDVQSCLNTLKTFTEAAPGSLKVSSSAQILKSAAGQDLLAVLIEAEGSLSFGPPSHRYTPLMFSLATGQRISCDQIFADCGQAKDAIEETLEERLGESLSNYLDASELFPFPLERFLLTETGVSFFYPEKSMVWLSGKSAFIHFLYGEIDGLLNTAPDSPLTGLSLYAGLSLGGHTRGDIEKAVSLGQLPGLPVKLGDAMNAVLEDFPLQHDPEGFASGQKYQLEDDRFRGTWLLSGDGQTVSGLFSRRVNLYGLITGKASLDMIKSALGEPASAVSLGFEAAQLYGVPAGTMLEYAFDGASLKLFVDEEQALSAVWLDHNQEGGRN